MSTVAEIALVYREWMGGTETNSRQLSSTTNTHTFICF